MSRLDTEIDRLYQLPLADFTAERNALAKREKARGGEIRALAKPSIAAWAVNQLYWRQRPIYERLVERAADLRSTHNAALRGRRTDLRGASRAHDEAFEDALKATLVLLAEEGHPVTDATRQAIATTLRALPGAEPAGRLSHPLPPIGFQVLGVPAPEGKVRPAPAKPAPSPAAAKGAAKERAARLAAGREAVAAAARAARDAEGVVRREEFEAARASRAASRALQRVKDAEEALRQAETEIAEARAAASAAERERDEAQARAARAATDLEHARTAEQAARKELDQR